MILLGIVLVVISLLAPGLGILTAIGIILIVIGVALVLLGASGHPAGGRRYWF